MVIFFKKNTFAALTTNALSKKLSDCYSPHGFYLFLPLFSSTTGCNRGFFPVGSAATQKKSPSVETGVEEGWPAAGELSIGARKERTPPRLSGGSVCYLLPL